MIEHFFGGRTLCVITGSYGSGKTEISVNLAMEVQKQGLPCTLVDLDVVNPYFRSRDVRDAFREKGIEVVAPDGHFSHADMPMLSPRVQGAIEQADRHVILDVGGDPAGARVLGRYHEQIVARGYHMVLVANCRRPETRTAEDIGAMADRIEATSHLTIKEIAANAHLMDETSTEIVLEGVEAARKAAQARGAGFHAACVLEDLAGRLDLDAVPARVFVLKKTMKKPWEGGRYAAYRC